MNALQFCEYLAAMNPSQRALHAARYVLEYEEQRRRIRQFAHVPAIKCVYFLRDVEGFIKIGWTGNLRRRVAALQVTSSAPLKLIGVVEGERHTERWLHRVLENHRVRGEWFRQNPALDAYLLGEGFVP